jgi:hypothetical protein
MLNAVLWDKNNKMNEMNQAMNLEPIGNTDWNS